MSELPDLEISKLPSIDAVNKDTDFLVISKESDVFASGYGSYKATPSQLVQSVNTTSLSQLSDVAISSPEDDQVLKYDSTSSKWVNGQGGGGGTDVEANPVEAATDTLNKLKVSGTVYSVGGGGGTNVVANPAGTATATLNKLQVEETIYSVGGGGNIYTDVVTTLAAGQTTVTVNNAAITANSIIDISTNPEIPFVSRSAVVGQVTVTFEAQASDVSVIISIRSIS